VLVIAIGSQGNFFAKYFEGHVTFICHYHLNIKKMLK
jgi:hypothetical protein